MAYFASPGDKRKREWTQGQLNLGVYLRVVEKRSYLKAARMPVTTLKNYVGRLKDESTETTLFKGIPVPKAMHLGGRTTLLPRTEAQLAEWLLSTLLRQFQDASAHGLEVVWTESSRKHSGELIC